MVRSKSSVTVSLDISNCLRARVLKQVAGPGIRYVDIRAIFAFDFLIMLGLTTYAALRMKRVDVLTPMPTYYVLRFINICLYVWAAIKVLLLPQRIARGGVWNTIRIANAPSSIKTAMKGGGSP